MTDDLPLVCLHGFLGCADDFAELEERLERQCLAFDLPGHGADPRQTSSFEAAVAWIAERLDEHDLPRVDVAAYSMGGRLAYGLIDAQPERVRCAVIVGANPGLADAEDRSRRAASDETLARRLETEPFEAFLRDWYRRPIFGRLREQPGFEAMLARRRRGRPTALAGALRRLSVGRQPSFWPGLSGLQTRLLLVAGGEDEKCARINASVVAAAEGAAVNLTIPGAAHAVPVEQPEAFAEAVRAFLTAP